jgi:hypothetical protein
LYTSKPPYQEELNEMQKWKYTSYENGEPVTRTGLTRQQAVRAIEDAIAGRVPTVEDDQHEHGTAEHRIAA